MLLKDLLKHTSEVSRERRIYSTAHEQVTTTRNSQSFCVLAIASALDVYMLVNYKSLKSCLSKSVYLLVSSTVTKTLDINF